MCPKTNSETQVHLLLATRMALGLQKKGDRVQYLQAPWKI